MLLLTLSTTKAKESLNREDKNSSNNTSKSSRLNFFSTNERSKGEGKGKEEEGNGKREREIGSEALAETEKIANFFLSSVGEIMSFFMALLLPTSQWKPLEIAKFLI